MTTANRLARASIVLLLATGLWQSGQQAANGAQYRRNARAETALRKRLDAAFLSYHWVVCVDMNRYFTGHRLIRCNVDFGDPHVVQYCVTFIGRRFITNVENHALNCDRRP